MKKSILIFVLIFAALVNMAADRSGLRIRTGYTMLTSPLVLNASDTINESDTITFTITNLQKYFQHQTFTVGLTDVDGAPNVTITAYGKVTSDGAWVAIGSPITWTTDSNDGDIASTTAKNYNYLKVVFLATATAQQSLINVFSVKTSNMYDIPANSGTLTVSRATTGTVTITSADNDANAALTIGAGGTGALTLGDATSTTAITSTDWAISATGAATGLGAITADGLITGAGVDIGTSKAIVGTTAMTVGNGNQTIAINSSDWDIGATGVATGLGNITSDGKITAADSLCLGTFRFIVRLDTLCSITGTDTLRIHPSR